MAGRFLSVLIALSALSGCHMGQYSLRLNQEHAVPFPEVNVLPEQWEPVSAEN